jgi:hypothetical protein
MTTSRGIQARDMTCTECGNHQTIHRKTSRLRSIGHIKHLWCIYCSKRTGHIEQRGEAISYGEMEINRRTPQIYDK